jgi:hypothetical protein
MRFPHGVALSCDSLRLPQVGASPLETALRHSSDVEQLVERRKGALTAAQLDDALRDRAPDSRYGGKLRGIGPVDVDALERRLCRTALGVPLRGVRTRRLTGERNVDFVTVGGPLRQIDRTGIGGGAHTAGQRDPLCVAVARVQMIEPGPFYRARDVDDQVVVVCLRLRAVTVPPPGIRAGEAGLRRRCRRLGLDRKRPSGMPKRKGGESERRRS